jgi:hypothetical protein
MNARSSASLFVLSLLFSACATSNGGVNRLGAAAPSQAASTETSAPAGDYRVDEQTSTDRYTDSGLTISPNSQPPAVSADAAYAAAKASGPVTVDGTRPAHLKLVTYTNAHHGKEAADGNLVSRYQQRSVWLVEIPDVPVVARGPGKGGVLGKAVVFIVVDATSGEVLESLQDTEFHL